ncbi:hypothetical protein [Tropicimonas marinistellae]|uniref:hypothetical protein n=1 Tax=Tropicimonas marinistellae TaxID=1739787 RepID=UPI00098F4D5D|nr:hypothetical protein [Tropicimonas marinistellae]
MNLNGHSSEQGSNGRASARGGMDATDVIALVLSALWLLGTGLFFLVLPEASPADQAVNDPVRFLMMVLAAVLPVAMIWVAATAAKSARHMREESRRLNASIDAVRLAQASHAETRPDGLRPPLEQKLDELVRVQKKTEAALAHLTSVNARAATAAHDAAAVSARPALGAAESTPAEKPEPEQPSLALGTTAEHLAEPLSAADFIKALNFPEDTQDKDGFRALRLALKDRTASPLVRSAQDVLTLLAEDGIYMDDLSPDRARPEIWRKFAAGDRGRTIASLGGIRDRSSLALTAGRMRQDPVFRDCAHHFLRRFDSTFATFEKGADDAEIAAFADTRSARAFMLIGRVSGTFD